MTSTVLPPEFETADAAIRAALAITARADEWDAPTRQQALAWLLRHDGVVAAMRAAVITAEREAGTWALTGDRDLAGFVGRTSRQGRWAGSAAVEQAATLAAMTTVADALVEGPVTPVHVQQLTRARSESPTLAAQLTTPEGQAQVVELARRMDGQAFGRALAQLSASLDPATRQREHDEQRANRCLAISHTPGGTLIKGQLDSISGHAFAKALDALNPRPTNDDERTRSQRLADALMTMVRRTVTDKSTTPRAVAPVQAVVTIDQGTWAALRAARDGGRSDRSGSTGAAFGLGRRPAAGSAADVIGRLRGAAPVTDEHGHTWPASEIAAALCDCELTRAVLGAPGVVLDLGRDERLFTRSQWLALYASGQRTCAVAGCTMPLRYTQLHHMTWWKRDGGTTNLIEIAPECFFHHQDIHRNDIRVFRRADGSYEHRWPDGRRYGGVPSDDGQPAPAGEPMAVAEPVFAAEPMAAGELMAVGEPMFAEEAMDLYG